MKTLKRLVGSFVACHALTLIAYLIPLIAAARSRGPRPPKALAARSKRPMLVVIAPCRHAAGSIAGFVASIHAQAYPADRVRIVMAIDRDEASDPSVEVARALGVEVRERFRPAIKTKGAAVNQALAALRDDPIDGVIIFDIDARPEPDFLARVAAHFRNGAWVLQAAAVGREPTGESARISEVGQAIARLYQRGRALLGWPGLLSGGAMAFRRDALERLDWQTSTRGHLSDDGELNLRCCLGDIPVRYAPDLRIHNDLPADAREVRLQRRRWSAGYQELAVPYFVPMAKKALRGPWRVIDCVTSLLFASTFSLAFLTGAALSAGLAVASLRRPALRRLAWAAAIPTAVHAGVYALAPRAAGVRLGFKELRGLPVFLAMRALAFVEGFGLAFRRRGRNPIPSVHRDPVTS